MPKFIQAVPGAAAVAAAAFVATPALAQKPAAPPPGFDRYVAQVLQTFSVPGVSIAIVKDGKVILAKGYGVRRLGDPTPVDAQTQFGIASNTKLFTATAVGLLVEDGKLDWDKPVRQYVPSIRFYDDALTSQVTIRDMLSHRTGITRHDSIWYKSEFTRQELFDRLKYLEPTQPLRSTFLYNNMMYAGVGYATELQSGKPWTQFVRERIFQPLEMKSSGFTIADML